MTSLSLDVRNVKVGHEGIPDFSWPVSRGQVELVRDMLSRELVQIAKDNAKSASTSANLVSILMFPIINEALTLYQAQNLANNMPLDESVAMFPDARILPALLSGVSPRRPPIVDTLLAGPTRHPHSWIDPRLLRSLGKLRRKQMPSFRFMKSDSTQDIVTVQWTPLTIWHSKIVKELVNYRLFSEIVVKPDRLFRVSLYKSEVAESVTDVIRASFLKGSQTLAPNLVDYFQRWVGEACDLVTGYMESMLKPGNNLPSHVWTGSGGGNWTRMIRHACLMAGGKVTGHDHSTGFGHLKCDEINILDFESCDVFVTTNKAQVSGLKRNIKSDLLVPDSPPEIVSLPRHEESKQVRLKPDKSIVREVKKIMYHSSFYKGEMVRYVVQMPDLVQLDWEARLFEHLSEWGYSVIHKPHPGSIGLPSRDFYKKNGSKLFTDSFEEVEPLADMFIFTSPMSTPVIQILKEQKPAVFVDLGIVDWQPEAYALLRKRCNIVDGWFDSRNRAQVNWNALQSAIETAPNHQSREFYDTYFKIGN